MMKRLLFRSRVLNNGRWLRQPLSVGEKRSLSGGAASSRKPCSSGGGSLFRVGANRTVVAPFAASNDYRRHYSELLLSSGTFITQHDKGSTARCSFFSTSTSPSKLSKRDVADLEERLWRRVGSSVSDPVLNRNVATDLQWLHRRIAISDDGTIQLLLKLPSLLHPSLTQLKDEIKDAAEKELQVWLNEKGMALRNDVDSEEGDNSSTPTSSAPMMKVNVEAMATKPVPMMARLVEDPKELLDGIGPGLANVGHFLAVYSCKVSNGLSHVAPTFVVSLQLCRVASIIPCTNDCIEHNLNASFPRRAELASQRSRSIWRMKWLEWVDGWGSLILIFTARLYRCLSSHPTQRSVDRRWGKAWSSP